MEWNFIWNSQKTSWFNAKQVCLKYYNLFNAKFTLLEEQQWFYLTHRWEDKGFHTFPKGICLKVNIARLEFKLMHYDSAVQCFNHFTTGTHSHMWVCGGYLYIRRSLNKFLTFFVWAILSYLPTPPLGQDMIQGQFLSEV